MASERTATGAVRPAAERSWDSRKILDSALARPWLILMFGLLPVLLAAVKLGSISQDPSVDAFVPADHPAAVARDRAKEVFGLEDPVVAAFVANDEGTVFTPERLDAIAGFTDAVVTVPGVLGGKVVSLVSESAIEGDDGDLAIAPIWSGGDDLAAQEASRRAGMMPMMAGTLVSTDQSAAMVVIPVEDPNAAAETVDAIRALAAESVKDAGLTPQIAGVATMNARLSGLIDSDRKKFVPGMMLTVLLIVGVSLRRFSPVLGSLLVLGGSAGFALGLMGWFGSKYYLITSALPVVIMTIAIADSIHLTIAYLEERRDRPWEKRAASMAEAMRRTVLPIVVTSVTTALGFTGLALGVSMVPIREFGLYAAAGTMAALFLSLTVLPAVLLLMRLEPGEWGPAREDSGLWSAVSRISEKLAIRPARAVIAGIVLTAGLVVIGFGARFDYQRLSYFTSDDPVRQADVAINEGFAGGNFLDVIVTAPAADGLLEERAMQDIASLQMSLSGAANVRKVTGIADYISVLHNRLTGSPEGSLPSAANAVAQYLLLYESSGDPGDFDEEIDYDYQTALIRAHLSTDRYSETRETVRQFTEIAAQWSATTGLSAEVGGRVGVNEGWMAQLSRDHFRGLGLALVFVAVGTTIMFRSLRLGVIATIPMLTGVALVYAAMAVFGIDIAPATSLCAALATGLGVDFGVHMGKELRQATENGVPVHEAVHGRYGLVFRACFLSAMSLAVGFCVLALSGVPVLRWFGMLLAAGTIGSLTGAFLFVPPLAALLFKERSHETVLQTA